MKRWIDRYRCSRCGAQLDPGERCGCRDKEAEQRDFWDRKLLTKECGQMAFRLDEGRGTGKAVREKW